MEMEIIIRLFDALTAAYACCDIFFRVRVLHMHSRMPSAIEK